jgi:putative CocE/NonD family hydrolase
MRRRFLRLLPLVIVWGFLLGAAAAVAGKGPSDAAWWGDSKDAPRPYHGYARTSFYVTMRDGVKIAVDLYLPKDLRPGDKLPAILDQTRYWRRIDLRPPFSWILRTPPELRRIVESGYAFVRTDVRGTGASFGVWPYPWARDEVKDGAEVVDWIIRQPWSSGAVGSVGGSYEGTSAEFLATLRHPAVKAIAPLFSLFDVYADVAFPGGVQLTWFTDIWAKGNRAMDTNTLADVYPPAKLAVRGVSKVDADADGALREAAYAAHAGNGNVHELAARVTYRDDATFDGTTVDTFSPHTYAADLRAAAIPVYSGSGWFDGGYSHAAIKRFLTVRNAGDRLTLGPWPHGGGREQRPFARPRPTSFDLVGELLRFFDRHLKGTDTGIDAEPPVHYFTMGEGRWKTAATWPPEGTTPTAFYLAGRGALRPDPPADADAGDAYTVNATAGTGDRSRWNALAEDVPVYYPDRRKEDKKLLVYQSEALIRPMEVTGHPIVTLHVTATKDDATVLVYLEDVDERGRVNYVSEGVLRALHRKLATGPTGIESPAPQHAFTRADAAPLVPGEVAELTFDLLPVSYLFAAGHRVRVAVAGADKDHFRILPGDPPRFTVRRDAKYPSRVVLPVMK